MAARLLQRYCERICPPSARNAVRIDFALERDRITLYELRWFCGVPGAARRVPLAQMRYNAARGGWRLLYADATERWRSYRALPASSSLVELLREIDVDPAGVFWPHVNGSSLRWCSSRGRCVDCDERYCAVLGLVQAAPLRSSGA
jgi:hypothetical protein